MTLKTKMKAFTNVEQSKKLAEILQLESADMYYSKYDTIHAETLYSPCDIQYFNTNEHTPCWSFAALLNVLPRYLKYSEGRCPLQLLTLDFENPHRKDHCWIVGYWDYDEEYEKYNFQIEVREEEVIDACYELILKLHEHKLI